MICTKKFFLLVLLFFFITAGLIYYADAASVGQAITNVTVKDANKKPAKIPFWGKKVLAIWYTDPDVDVVDPLGNKIKAAVKAGTIKKANYQSVGFVNAKDTWIPNFLIRKKVNEKMQKFPGLIVLMDEAHVLKTSWKLGDCDGCTVLIIIGKDQKVKFIEKIKTKSQAEGLVSKVVKLLSDETK